MSTTMSDNTIMRGQEGTSSEQAKFPRPAWATETYYPEDGSYTGEVTVGDVTLSIGQDITFGGETQPIHVWLPEVERLEGAQACRDLAAALLEAAQIIEAATA
jgi:hypothetical protein